jgi:hypothetical protein
LCFQWIAADLGCAKKLTGRRTWGISPGYRKRTWPQMNTDKHR